MTREPWNKATRPKTKTPQCEGETKFMEGPNKGQPGAGRCKRNALDGFNFCKTHLKELGK